MNAAKVCVSRENRRKGEIIYPASDEKRFGRRISCAG